MKTISNLTATAAISLLLFASCGKGDVKAGELLDGAKSAVADLDLTKMSPEAVTEKVGGLVTELTSKLGSITDLPSAKDVVGKLGPVVEKLQQAKTMLGDKMPDLASLKTTAQDLMTKFKDNDAIKSVLQPLLDKLMAMFS